MSKIFMVGVNTPFVVCCIQMHSKAVSNTCLVMLQIREQLFHFHLQVIKSSRECDGTNIAGLKDSLEGAAKQKKKETENAKLTPWEQYQKNKKDKKRQKEREKKRKVSSVFETCL